MKNFREYLGEAFPFGSHDDVEAETPHIKISHSLLIRLFEYFHENSSYNDDEDIHDIAELIFDVGSDGEVVGMDDYDYIIGNDEEDDEFTEETETADQIKRKIVQKHAGHFPQAAQDYLHKSKTYGNKAYDHLEAEHGIKIGHAKSAIDNIKRDMKSSFGSSGPSLNAAGRINRYLNQKTIGPRGNR
jgi:hypothetical protein